MLKVARKPTWRHSLFIVTTSLPPDFLYVVVSHSELDFKGAQKVKPLTKTKYLCTEILQKLSFKFYFEKKKAKNNFEVV